MTGFEGDRVRDAIDRLEFLRRETAPGPWVFDPEGGCIFDADTGTFSLAHDPHSVGWSFAAGELLIVTGKQKK